MRLSTNTGLSVLLIGACLAACAEVPAVGEGNSQFTDSTEFETAQQGVRLQTRFVLVGVDGVQADFGLEHLAIHVGALLLDPSDGGDTSFASREPFELAFNVAAGRTDIQGPEIVLPFAGDFFVSMQVEPASISNTDSKELDADNSVVAHGYCGHGEDSGVDADEPSPLPWEPKSTDNLRAFTYRSDRVARIQLGEVQLREDGAYELLLTVNVSDWLREQVLPVVEEQARVADAAAPDANDDEPDVENAAVETVLDVDGASTRSLIGDIGLGTRRF